MLFRWLQELILISLQMYARDYNISVFGATDTFGELLHVKKIKESLALLLITNNKDISHCLYREKKNQR